MPIILKMPDVLIKKDEKVEKDEWIERSIICLKVSAQVDAYLSRSRRNLVKGT